MTSEILTYSAEVQERTESGKLDISLNSTSLREYLRKKLSALEPPLEVEEDPVDADLVEELQIFGINTLSDLDGLMTDEFFQFQRQLEDKNTTLGLLRDVMIYSDIDKYFSKAWRRNWNGWDELSFELMAKKYGETKMETARRYYGFEIISRDDYLNESSG